MNKDSFIVQIKALHIRLILTQIGNFDNSLTAYIVV